MVNDMMTRIDSYVINLGEIAEIDTSGVKDNYEMVDIKVLYKSGVIRKLELSQKSYKNLMSYFNALSPDFNDDYTRNMMIQAIMNQRQQFAQKMMAEGKMPKTDFPERMVVNNQQSSAGGNIR